ncbi:hypothetical protein MTR_7g018600 [Medicago truncatula]|uniref:Uncharacterized protein n=1 Tax=Medicago truncatula TaxID=3880 RepID=A0A072TY70_MEDTR|nr:hypothetical protein MTR_7g018600 [Medicago truncatula]
MVFKKAEDIPMVEEVGWKLVELQELVIIVKRRAALSPILGFSTTLHGSLIEHLTQFGGLGGFSNKSRLTFNIIWISTLFITWKDRKRRHFHNKTEQPSSLLEKVKLQAYWWLKSYYVLFDLEYTVWRLTPLLCFQAVT